MSKVYISEQELWENWFEHFKGEDFEQWVDSKMEKGEIELVEFNNYEISNLSGYVKEKIVNNYDEALLIIMECMEVE